MCRYNSLCHLLYIYYSLLSVQQTVFSIHNGFEEASEEEKKKLCFSILNWKSPPQIDFTASQTKLSEELSFQLNSSRLNKNFDAL